MCCVTVCCVYFIYYARHFTLCSLCVCSVGHLVHLFLLLNVSASFVTAQCCQVGSGRGDIEQEGLLAYSGAFS